MKILEVDPDKFIIKTQSKTVLWNIKEESADEIMGIPSVSPLLCEYMSGKIIVSDTWIQAYPADIK